MFSIGASSIIRETMEEAFAAFFPLSKILTCILCEQTAENRMARKKDEKKEVWITFDLSEADFYCDEMDSIL